MPIELTYFQLKGVGEQCRLLLAYGGEDFKDIRMSSEEWAAFKPKTPFGQMPVLEIDGKQYTQSIAIARYLGRRYGLAGNDIEEDFEIDQNVNFVTDLCDKVKDVKQENDPVIKAKKYEEYTKNDYPRMLEKMDALLKTNNGYVACSRLTWADFVLAGIYDFLKYEMRNPDLDSQYSSLKKLQQTVYSLPKVKAWADAAPAYKYPY